MSFCLKVDVNMSTICYVKDVNELRANISHLSQVLREASHLYLNAFWVFFVFVYGHRSLACVISVYLSKLGSFATVETSTQKECRPVPSNNTLPGESRCCNPHFMLSSEPFPPRLVEMPFLHTPAHFLNSTIHRK